MLSTFFFTSGEFIKIEYLYTIFVSKVWKSKNVGPIYDPQEVVMLQFRKIPKVLLSSQAWRPMYHHVWQTQVSAMAEPLGSRVATL
jgi:hypothetical protein